MKARAFPVILSCAALLAACGGGSAVPPTASSASPSSDAPHSGGTVRVQGAGSTFDFPLFSKVFPAYQQQAGIEVNYQSIGSGGGVEQLTNKTVDFGASDFPLNDEQTKAAQAAGGDVLHIPVTLGAVSVGYNLPGVSTLKLDGPTLAGIYLGQVTTWNDPAIAALNPGVSLPSIPIAVVHRSDGSGTTFIFTSYLNAVSAAWKAKVGASGSVNWPVGIGGKGSEGVAGQVNNTPGGIGYFELAYAKQSGIVSALLKNQAGKFVEPSSDGAAAAAADAAANMPADLKALFVNAAGSDSYPIAGFSWVVLYKNQPDVQKGKELAALLDYLVTQGQTFAKPLYYAPLPQQVQELDKQAIQSISVGASGQ